MTLDVQLDSLDGISYLTQADGTIAAVGASRWNVFAHENDAPELLDQFVVGRNLFDFLSGVEVKSHLKQIMGELAARVRPACVMPFRCDAPDRLRNMRQSITPVFRESQCWGFLFQSVELESHLRPPIDLYDFKARMKRAAEDRALPIIAMCSWCLQVRSATVTANDWVKAEEYYAAGGRSDVQITHGICKVCSDSLRIGSG